MYVDTYSLVHMYVCPYKGIICTSNHPSSHHRHTRLSINLSSWPSQSPDYLLTTCRPVSLHILLALADIEIRSSKIIVLVFSISFGLMPLNACMGIGIGIGTGTIATVCLMLWHWCKLLMPYRLAWVSWLWLVVTLYAVQSIWLSVVGC
ncbi:unnamed protein product [Ceratitis capitata]|uniref:(Mediterranean fruit fly) hypothetical protein n=1 Tax=Ceratitis capitata TaxID=7213 RepID=A0A811VG94_CERCA|nr:unnamed protein product [Ceratitis capitata]